MTLKKISQFTYILLFSLSLQGCGLNTHNTPQGNIMSDENIAQLKQGMSLQQVKKLLGTPVIAQNKGNALDTDTKATDTEETASAFSEDDKDSTKLEYVYFFQPNSGNTIRKRIRLIFEDGKLTELNILT